MSANQNLRTKNEILVRKCQIRLLVSPLGFWLNTNWWSQRLHLTNHLESHTSLFRLACSKFTLESHVCFCLCRVVCPTYTRKQSRPPRSSLLLTHDSCGTLLREPYNLVFQMFLLNFRVLKYTQPQNLSISSILRYQKRDFQVLCPYESHYWNVLLLTHVSSTL